jgi:hypothetical protein
MAKHKFSDLSPRQQEKFKKVMREYANDGLRSSSGSKVTTRAQAVAIAFSEAEKVKRR